MTVRSRWPLLAAVLALTLTMLPAACGGDDAPPPPTPRPPSTVVPPSAPPPTPEAAATEAVTATTAATTTFAPAQLPADGETPVLQLARIDHTPWEPALLAQMTPHFSLQANGRIVFSHPGPDATGWYQSIIPPEAVRNFVRIFADEIDVFDLATRHNAEPVLFAVGRDGAPLGCRATGVIFVRTAAREGRLVMSECDINAPKGPDKARIDRLKEIVNMVQLWKEGVNGPIDADRQAAITTFLGWWTDTRVPYTPESSVAFISRAPRSVPADPVAAPRAEWPLDQAITSTLRADYGARPGELLLGAAETEVLLTTARARFGTPYGPRAWGPLFTDGDGNDNLVGIRPAVPGANEVVLEPYVYHAPPPDYGPARP